MLPDRLLRGQDSPAAQASEADPPGQATDHGARRVHGPMIFNGLPCIPIPTEELSDLGLQHRRQQQLRAQSGYLLHRPSRVATTGGSSAL